MAESSSTNGDGLRRSSRVRKQATRFEDTEYAADILHTQLRNTDTFEDFMATLFLCFKPACHRPDLWRTNRRCEHRSIYMLASRYAKAVGLDPEQLLDYALDFSRGTLDDNAFVKWVESSEWRLEGVREFLQTIGLAEATLDDDDDDEDEDGDHENGEEEEEEDDEEDDDDEGEEEEEEEDQSLDSES